MNVESNNTAETVTEQTDHGNIITIQTTLGDEDEDVHRCGRCQSEFCTLEAFIQHKLHNSCQRPQDLQIPRKDPQEHSQEVVSSHRGSVTTIGEDERSVSPETDQRQGIDGVSGCVAASAGRRRRHGTGKVLSHSEKTAILPNDASEVKIAFKANREGRYLCQICEKTFKTPNILRTHMSTHCEKKNFNCNLCGSAFRTKGSLIRHNRRHTDERPYRCNLCGLSFRESGALTRHLKSITPCTEKIRFSQCQEILVNKDGVQKGMEEEPSGLVPPEGDQLPAESMEDSSGETIHEVHIKMDLDATKQAQQVEEEQAQAVAEGDSLICQAIINSGIALESEDGERTEGKSPKPAVQSHDPENRPTEIQVTEECVEMDSDEAGDTEDRPDELTSSKTHKCPHCNRVFKAINYLRVHVKGHLGYRPFKCMVCGKEFLTGYLLKKHMEAHLSERRFKCGECGKLYKTIGHVREHMRAHSDDRPYHCNRCSKGYKTKNALQVHQRTHAQERPYVCQFCSRAFREKGSLVRHIRHHTGEKPFKCYKCGRGFAEHGTLNRHLRAKGGCFGGLKESEQAVVSEEPAPADSVAATIISEDPHAVLVEFSSVVADTQEYIIGAPSDVSGAGGEVTLIPDSRHEMGSHIMKVVQQIVNQSSGQHQIIVQNLSVDEGAAVSADCSDTITIATPESLTEQVAMTLASAIGDGTILTAGGALEAADGTVTMVASQDIEVMEQAEEFVITSPEEVEIQTVIVQD